MHVIIIDDEPLAIDSLKNKLQLFPDVTIVATFTNPATFLEQFPALTCDAIFLDIQMPKLNGLQLAALIKAQREHVHLVFVTAYREYSLEAFEVPSLDYLLKPISKARLEKTMERLAKALSPQLMPTHNPPTAATIAIQCHATLTLTQQQQIISWKSEKVRELFAYFFLHKEQPISPDFLIEMLWPSFDLARGKANLHTNISMLRRFLNTYNIEYELSLINRTYIFSIANVQCDYIELMDILNAYMASKYLPSLQQARHAMTLYHRGLLTQEDFSWLASLQLDVENKLSCYLQSTLSHIDEQEKLNLFAEYVDLFPLNERIVKQYIDYLQQQQLHAEAAKVYQRYCKQLDEELQLTPGFTLLPT